MTMNAAQRANHEATDDILYAMRMLMVLADTVDTYAPPEGEHADRQRAAARWAYSEIFNKFSDLNLARAREWVGLGGVSSLIPADGERQ